MRLSKNLGVALMAGLLVGSLAACSADTAGEDTSGSGSAADGDYRVGVTVDAQSTFTVTGKDAMNIYGEKNGITVDWQSPEYDVGVQADQIDKFVSAGVDAIMVVPVQATALGPQIQAAKDAGIPVITVNATLEDTSLLTSSVLPDDVTAGAQEMQMMADELGGKGNILILQGQLGSSPEQARTKGNQQVLEEYPDMNVLAMDTATWKRDEAVNRVKNWIAAFGDDIDGIVAQNDDMALGALQATKEAGIKVPIVGIDGVLDALNAVKAGELIGTSMQDGRVEYAAALAVANRAIRGESVEDLYVYTMPPVTKDNVDEFLLTLTDEADDFLQMIPSIVDRNLDEGRDMADVS